LNEIEHQRILETLEIQPTSWKESIPPLFTHDFLLAQTMCKTQQDEIESSVLIKCQAAKTLCYINPEGEVSSCLALPLPIGTIKHTSLREVG
jgi:MoaA/NifB/PqqE/SkfB family radical SAM enzyme